MKKVKALLALTAIVAMVALAGIANAQVSSQVNVTANVGGTFDIQAANCGTAPSLLLDTFAGTNGNGDTYDEDADSCEFTVQANQIYDVQFAEYEAGTPTDQTDDYEAGMEYTYSAGAGQSHPDVILDCDEDENGAGSTCNLTDRASETDESEWGVYFTDGTAFGEATVTTNKCTGAAEACNSGSAAEVVVQDGSATTGGTTDVEGILFNVDAYVSENVTSNTGYTDGIQLTLQAG